MYSRTSGDDEFTFQTSGGLLNASLVMIDNETNSYWSIISDEAIYGPESGQTLTQIPGSIKATFGDWKARHPNTKVLSVGGKEHNPESPYDRYFESDQGFRNLKPKDDRLAPKAEIFSFHLDGAPHAVPHPAFEKGGGTVTLEDGRELFLYRQKNDSFYRSTVAFLAPPGASFVRKKGSWTLMKGDDVIGTFDDAKRSFGDSVEAFQGFDTYWYIWSLTNTSTKLLGA